MINENLREDIDNITRKLNKKNGYGGIFLDPIGARIIMGKNNLKSKSYLSLWRLNNKLQFLGCDNGAFSFDETDENEVKRVTVLLHDKGKAPRVYISTNTDLDAETRAGTEYLDSFQCLTDPSSDLSFFILATFDSESITTGLYIYSNAEFPVKIFNYLLDGDLPLNELRDFLTLLFAFYTNDMNKKERYWKFLNSFMEEEEY